MQQPGTDGQNAHLPALAARFRLLAPTARLSAAAPVDHPNGTLLGAHLVGASA